MEQKILMPRLSDSMESAVVTAWHKNKGEAFQAGDVLFEVETDKVVSEIEAECAGVLTEILVAEGDSAAPGEAVAVFDTDSD